MVTNNTFLPCELACYTFEQLYLCWIHKDITEISPCVFDLCFIALKEFYLLCRRSESRSLTVFFMMVFLLEISQMFREEEKK